MIIELRIHHFSFLLPPDNLFNYSLLRIIYFCELFLNDGSNNEQFLSLGKPKVISQSNILVFKETIIFLLLL